VSHAKICDDSMLLILFKEKIVTDKLSSFMVALCPDSIFFFILNFSFNKLTRQTLQKNLLDNFPFNRDIK